MSPRAPSRIGQVIAIISILVILLIGIVFALQSSVVLQGVCADTTLKGLVPSSVLSKVCPVNTDDGQFPAGTSDQTPVTSNTPVVRGMVCPASAVPGTPTVISWSCGNSTLRAVAGFTLVDRTQTNTTVTPSASSIVYGIQCADGYQSVCSINTVSPQVTIWADPPHVRLGARANIFWQGNDVLGCHVVGPSFDESGINGAAATVPITTTTTFTATCLTTASTTVSASVKVDFAQ